VYQNPCVLFCSHVRSHTHTSLLQHIKPHIHPITQLLSSEAGERILAGARAVLVTEELLQQTQENYALEMISMCEATLAASEQARLEEEAEAEERERVSLKVYRFIGLYGFRGGDISMYWWCT